VSIDDLMMSQAAQEESAHHSLPEQHWPVVQEEQALSLFARWNATARPYAREATVPQLVSRQAALTPEALALTQQDQRLSYRDLNRRANQLAHYLRQVGVGPDVLVGICVPRSLDLVVGLLGILQAGGAYVPLDPTYPRERKRFMLEDAQTPLVLTCARFADELAAAGRTLLCLDRDARLWCELAEDDLDVAFTLEQRAYVIYTSGSTGHPKGVEVSHGNLLNLVYWHRRAYEIAATDRATQITSPAFDATGWELWPYLTSGASVHFVAEEARVAPLLLRDWLVEQQITVTFVPTVLAEKLLDLDWPARSRLRYLLTGADTLQRYPPLGLPFTLVNNYGPTETTVVATSGVVPAREHAEHWPPIGRPIDNTQIYLLDAEMNRVPPGEPGELYIGGESVASGYLRRPELTRERFVPDPFRGVAGARLYKTGDLARYLPDGQLAFLGRADFQIKIRGYRIEPDEIESALTSYPGVKKSVVLAHETPAGEKELVAYLVLAPDSRMLARDLKAALGVTLPAYMIPSTYVVLADLPMTLNGKIDRAALPQPDQQNTLRDEVIVLPATPLEEHLEQIVSSLLKLEHVSVEDNFFLLGGHSLLGTQIIARIKAAFEVNLALRSLFEAPTVRALALKVESLILEKLDSMSDEEVQQLLS
jgi:amino acid adenylation domain-containing protein